MSIPCTISFSEEAGAWRIAVEDSRGRTRTFSVAHGDVDVDVEPLIEETDPTRPLVIEGQGTVRCRLCGYPDEETACVEIPNRSGESGAHLRIMRSALLAR